MDIPDYQLLRRIGKGGYGEVWLARALTGEYRALKIVRRDGFDESESCFASGGSSEWRGVSSRAHGVSFLSFAIVL